MGRINYEHFQQNMDGAHLHRLHKLIIDTDKTMSANFSSLRLAVIDLNVVITFFLQQLTPWETSIAYNLKFRYFQLASNAIQSHNNRARLVVCLWQTVLVFIIALRAFSPKIVPQWGPELLKRQLLFHLKRGPSLTQSSGVTDIDTCQQRCSPFPPSTTFLIDTSKQW